MIVMPLRVERSNVGSIRAASSRPTRTGDEALRREGAAPDGVDTHVGAAAGPLEDGGHDIRCLTARAVENHLLRALGASQAQRVGVAIDRDDPRAARRRDGYRAEPHPATAEHDDPLVRLYVRSGVERPVSGGEPAPQARGGLEAHPLGHGHEVDVGLTHRDVFGERTPVSETRLLLVRAHLRVAAQAPLTPPAALDEGHGDGITRLPPFDAGPHLGDDAGELMPRYV